MKRITPECVAVFTDPFDPEEFVERLAWRITSNDGWTSSSDFDPFLLHESFELAIRDLKGLNERYQRKSEKVKSQCEEEETQYWAEINDLLKNNQIVVSHFHELDERISSVATKVVHLGDQLESVNTPRARAVEAQKLMNYFAEFLKDEPIKLEVFNDPFQLHEAADIIQKLYLIAQELPEDKFQKALQRIAVKYNEIELALINEFIKAHHTGDKELMKELANMLSHFKGHSQCIDAFIQESQKHAFLNENVFDDVLPLCERTSHVITKVFTAPESVMTKLVRNIYLDKIQKHIQTKLTNKSDNEKYLKELYDLYSRTSKLSVDLTVFKISNDTTFLNKLTKQIFSKYLESYIDLEMKYLKEKSNTVLVRYYESKNHQKKQIQSGGFSDLKRDIQARIGTKANIKIASIETYGDETFLSEEVAINLLQETKTAFKRCEMLSELSHLSDNAVKIFEILIQYLCMDHIDYAIELAQQAIPPSEPKSRPLIYFFDVVRQANSIFHLLEKQFSDSLVPLVISTPQHFDCVTLKKKVMEQLESKLDVGLDRTITAIVGWIKAILSIHQLKSDFKPEIKNKDIQYCTPACEMVKEFLKVQLDNIKKNLDGKNVEAVVTELGIQVHRVLYRHLQQFQYNSVGAMMGICDVNVYGKCFQDFNVPLVHNLFETLQALFNLLVVEPENIKQICNNDLLAGLDRSVLTSFIQLREKKPTS